MTQFDSPVLNLKSHQPSRLVRFGSQPAPALSPTPLTQPQLDAIADQFALAARQAEGMPGADVDGNSPFDQLVARFLNGNSALGRKLAHSISRVMTGTMSTRSCQPETYTVGTSPRQGYRVKSGTLDKLFQKRGLTSGQSQPFNQFLEQKFGKDQRVIISLTGWTKPPVEPLLQNDFYRRQMDKLPKEQWPQFAEKAYVSIIKEFLSDIIRGLKNELPEFNPITDLGIIYGVTPEGVDRGVQEFCMQNSVPIAGLTCYDWAEYIPDEAGLPEVFIADDPAHFGKLMADSSNKVVVSGGRSFAAGVKLDGEKAAGADRRIPVDLFKSYAGVTIPAVVPGEDEITAKIVNAAALAKAMGLDPWHFDVVQKAINGRQTDNPDEFATIHILKKELEKLYQIRDIAAQAVLP